MRKLLLVLLTLLLLAMVTQAQEQDDELALEIVANINAWRISEGVWPLKTNVILEAMALDQAWYITSLDDLPDDLHLGRRGLRPRQRALVAPFNWPHYQLESQIAIGENAALGSVSSAMNFWRNSDLHSRTALNPAYREIGVAAVPYGGDTFFIVVFGSRPNVLPALADPTEPGTIFLSNEQFQYAPFYNSIHTATDVRLFDSAGRPLSDETVAWAEKITLLDSVGDTLFILSSDGEHQVLSAVNLDTDMAILPGYLPSQVDAPVVAAAPTATPMPQPSPTAVADEPTATPQPAVEATATPAPVVDPDIRIVYTGDTLDVMNVSGSTADWQGLELIGARTFPFSLFSSVADFPISALPAGHCLQIRSTSISGLVNMPDGCGWVRSLVTLGPDRLFWSAAAFDVVLNGNTLATCSVEAGVCDVALP